MIARVYDYEKNWNGRIRFHKDADCFQEQVFGIILQNDYTENGLHYLCEDGFYNTEYALREIFIMTADCRTKWMHGVEFWRGRRVSVTWRWYKNIDEFLGQMAFGNYGMNPAPNGLLYYQGKG